MKIRPTKLEFIRLKKRYNIIKKTKKMLKDKLDTQMSEIVKIWREAFSLRKKIESMVLDPYSRLALLASVMGSQEFKSNINYLGEFSSINMKEKKLFNIYVPKFELIFSEHNDADMPVAFNKNIRLIRQKSAEILKTLISMAEHEESIRRLIDEVRSTQIKVNALEKRVIPETEKELTLLKKFLKEKDREWKIRLKKVEEMVKITF